MKTDIIVYKLFT